MRILALETSTMLGGASFSEDGKILFCEESLRQNSHSEVLNTFIQNGLSALNWTLDSIDYFAIGQGPGSFTGVRVAANVGKTFSYYYKKKLVTVDSHEQMAFQVNDFSLPVLTIINAYKNMVYLSYFEPDRKIWKRTRGPEVVPVKDLPGLLQEDCMVIGDGFHAYEKWIKENVSVKMHRPETNLDYPSSKSLAALAFDRINNGQTMDWNLFVPLYLRASEAEENKQGIVFRPLT